MQPRRRQLVCLYYPFHGVFSHFIPEALTVPYTHEQYVKDRHPVLVEPPVSKVVRRAKSAGASSPKDASVSSFFETSTTSAADSGDPLVRQQSDSVLHPGQIHQQHDAVNNDIEPKGYPDSSTGNPAVI